VLRWGLVKAYLIHPAVFGGSGNSNGSTSSNKTGNEVCRDYFLRNAHGGGNLVADYGVPYFSLISAATNTVSYLKGVALSVGTKTAVVSSTYGYGKLLTVTGNNMQQYPGLAEAGANLAERGSFIQTSAATAGKLLSYAALAAGTYATIYDIGARLACRDVN
jgi:hypothetical protein